MTDWLIGTLVASSALMLLVLALRTPVRRLFGPTVAYALWLLPAARMVFPPLLQTVERPVPVAPDFAIADASVGGLDPAVIVDPSLLERLGGWSTLAVAGWLIGALAMLGYGFLQYRAQRRSILDDAVQLARIGSIRMVRSERVRGPMAFGILDRVIIVPLDFTDRFSESQARLALDHELAHHRSFDLVANLIAFVLLCLQWFNPLAWAAHAAFRFDQEAACDARVLDKADGRDRAIYGQAIAKAATGRALLFAGALDRPSTLSRRLTIMAQNTSRNARTLGFALVGGTILAALPLTASWAIAYVDVPRPTSLEPATHAPAPRQLDPASSAGIPGTAGSTTPSGKADNSFTVRSDGSVVLPGGVILDKNNIAFFTDDRILIHGRVKTLDQLTRAERAEVRPVLAKSRHDYERERAALPSRLAEARREADRIRSGDYKREILRDRDHLRRDLAEIDAEAAELRANGENPEKMKAEMLHDLREMEAIDIDAQAREELADLDPHKIVAELRSDERQMLRMQARLDQLDRRN